MTLSTPALTSGGLSLLVPALLILVGVVGIVVPVVPGLLLVFAGVFVWALDVGGSAWAVLAVVGGIHLAGLTLQYLLPGRRLRAHGVGGWTLFTAAVGGIIGFFVIPVVGLPVGFVVTIFVIERWHSGSWPLAWLRTKRALRAVLLSWGIELLTALAMVAVWLVGVFTLQ